MDSTSRGLSASLLRWFGQNWFRLAITAIGIAALAILREHLGLVRAAAQQAALTSEQRYREEAYRSEVSYVARRRDDCYDIYARERERFSNVQAVVYDTELDRCEVMYCHTGPRQTNSACELLRDTSLALTQDTTIEPPVSLDTALG